MTTQLKDSRVDSHQLQIDLEQARHEYEALQTQTNGEIHTLTGKIDILQHENRTLSEGISGIQEEQRQTKDISEKLQSIELNFKNTHEELLEERKKSENLRQEHEREKSILSETLQEREKLLTQRQELQTTEHQLRDEITLLQEFIKEDDLISDKLIVAQGECEKLKNQNQQLQRQMNDMRQAALLASAEKFEMPEGTASDAGSHIEEDSGIPVFNLAEQIMEEHRRSVANRRQRLEPVSSTSPRGKSIKRVVQQYVGSVGPVPIAADRKTSIDHHPWAGQSLTPFQQEILEEIVRKDMECYSYKNLTPTKYSSMNN